MDWRYLDSTLGDPRSNLALEEALFSHVERPTLRVWANQRSVVVGRAQLAVAETDLGACWASGIPVVRRFTAGGTVYNGPGNLNWSFFVPLADGEALMDAAGVFRRYGETVADALRACSVGCEFRPPNSISDANGKISGMAAYISKRALLCHGTLLISADLEEVARLTTPKADALPPRYPRSRPVAVSNCGVDEPSFRDALACVVGCPPDADVLKESELAEASALVRSKYALASWNLADPFPSD